MQNMGIEVLFKGINSLRLWQGLWVTIRIALISMVFSIILGFLLGMVMNIPNKIIKFICRIYLEMAGLSLYYPSADYKKTSSIRSESSYPNDQDHITGSSYRSSRGVKSWKTDHRCITLYKSDSGPLGIWCSILYVFYHMFSIFQTLQSTGKEVC